MGEDDRISELLERRHTLITVSREATVQEAAGLLTKYRIGCLPVISDEGSLLGVVSERDLVARCLATGLDSDRVRVEQIMTTDVATCPESMSVHDAERMMAHRKIRHLPVVRGGKVVGILSMRDVMADTLRSWKKLAHTQSAVLDKLESTHPGISQIRRDKTGRVVI